LGYSINRKLFKETLRTLRVGASIYKNFYREEHEAGKEKEFGIMGVRNES